MFRRVIIAFSIAAMLLTLGCSRSNKKVQNPIADINSKQPDKSLYDRAMDAIKHGKYDVARLSLQTLINTYPDSEYVARAKLAIGDSWYAEGGSAAMTQAESEYKDFITFFPNMPEAAEAQMKIGNIHYKEMEKADRDPTHARHAEEEYRQVILQFPDSPLVPQAKQRLLEVQEVLADREYMIGHFYFLREVYPAAIARLKSLADTYPLYSGADQTLYELGNCYEREVEFIRRSKLPEVAKGALIKEYTEGATTAYDRILTRYPLEARAEDAKRRLEAMKQPVPHATEAAVAENKAEIASRGSLGHFGKLMENFHKGPDVSDATKVGEPTLVDPKQLSAPELVRAADTSVITSIVGSRKVGVERVENGAVPAANAPVPRSDAEGAAPAGSIPATGNAAGATPGTAPAEPASSGAGNGAPSNPASDSSAVPEMKNDLQPAAATPPPGATAPPLGQVNEAAAASSSSDNSTQPAPAASSGSAQQSAPPTDANKESSSNKKKKHHLWPF